MDVLAFLLFILFDIVMLCLKVIQRLPVHVPTPSEG